MHDCPECGQACYCCGDIEDHDTGERYTLVCECCFDAESVDDLDDDFRGDFEAQDPPGTGDDLEP